MNQTIDLGNNETQHIGVFNHGSQGWLAITQSQSKWFKTERGAKSWFERMRG